MKSGSPQQNQPRPSFTHRRACDDGDYHGNGDCKAARPHHGRCSSDRPRHHVALVRAQPARVPATPAQLPAASRLLHKTKCEMDGCCTCAASRMNTRRATLPRSCQRRAERSARTTCWRSTTAPRPPRIARVYNTPIQTTIHGHEIPILNRPPPDANPPAPTHCARR